jgi:hydroxyacyl-ACP dehydratase HTD2-like protein with hotdog domain
MEWSTSNLLRIGEQVTERTFVDKVEVKKMGGGKGGEMLLVWVRKEFENDNGIALQDRRSWIFQKALDQNNPLPAPPRVDIEAENKHPAQPPSEVAQQDKPAHRLQLKNAELFRYSALTFNGHAIHLDPEWCREREGHASTVVHGPLNLTLLLRKWMIDTGKVDGKDLGRMEDLEEVAKAVSSVQYRAKKPVYAGQTYWLQSLQEKGKKGEDVVQAVRPDGAVIVEASVQ